MCGALDNLSWTDRNLLYGWQGEFSSSVPFISALLSPPMMVFLFCLHVRFFDFVFVVVWLIQYVQMCSLMKHDVSSLSTIPQQKSVSSLIPFKQDDIGSSQVVPPFPPFFFFFAFCHPSLQPIYMYNFFFLLFNSSFMTLFIFDSSLIILCRCAPSLNMKSLPWTSPRASQMTVPVLRYTSPSPPITRFYYLYWHPRRQRQQLQQCQQCRQYQQRQQRQQHQQHQ